jgi:hypothetical protein
MKIHLVRAELFHAGGQTDRYDEGNSHISQFCESLEIVKNVTIYSALMLVVKVTCCEL